MSWEYRSKSSKRRSLAMWLVLWFVAMVCVCLLATSCDVQMSTQVSTKPTESPTSTKLQTVKPDSEVCINGVVYYQFYNADGFDSYAPKLKYWTQTGVIRPVECP